MNKVLIKLYAAEIDRSYDVFIPVNEVVWKVKKMMIKCIIDMSNISFDENKEYLLINKTNGRIYKNNEIIIDTDIRNSSELLICSSNKENSDSSKQIETLNNSFI